MWIFTHNQGDKIWKKLNQRQKNLLIPYSYHNLAHISMLYNKRNVLQIHNSIPTLYQKWNWSWTWIKISIKPKLRLNQKSLQKRLNTICWLYHHCICLEIGYLAGKLIGDIYSEWIPNLNQKLSQNKILSEPSVFPIFSCFMSKTCTQSRITNDDLIFFVQIIQIAMTKCDKSWPTVQIIIVLKWFMNSN